MVKNGAHNTDQAERRISEKSCDWLDNIWYVAGLSKRVKPGALVRKILFGEPVLLTRAQSGQLFALRDMCPHRGAPLSKGCLHEERGVAKIACPYHGWQFDAKTGACTHIPALSENDPQDYSSIRVRSYPVEEKNGLIWIFLADTNANEGAALLSPFDVGIPDHFKPKSVTIVEALGPYQEAVIGLVDPAHTPFVHQQWWWRKGRAAQEKIKNYVPLDYGFRIPGHPPSSNSLVYKMLGGAPTTQIDFLLPGLRIETIRNDKATIIGMTAITPLEKGRSQITHLLYWDKALLSFLKPMIDAMASSFLMQDAMILRAQATNLDHYNHHPLYLGDPDLPAKWLFLLNRAWREQMARAHMFLKTQLSPRN